VCFKILKLNTTLKPAVHKPLLLLPPRKPLLLTDKIARLGQCFYRIITQRFITKMTKAQVAYECSHCGRRVAREMGRCPACGKWNTMQEVLLTPSLSKPAAAASTRAHLPGRAMRLNDISGDPEARFPLPISEFARVLGGGIVPGSVVLVGGDPGIGKSTLLLQLALVMAEQAPPVLYVSGEESARQIKMRALRLNQQQEKFPEHLYLAIETNLDAVIAQIETVQAKVVVIDSVQTMFDPSVQSAAGSVAQVRECAHRLTALAKTANLALFLIGHVTKEGTLAGPRVLEHTVDTVLYLEGDRHHAYRLLRGVKNRFGATSEVGVFEMRGAGMVEVTNPSEVFLAERMVNAPGSAVVVTMEGTRPLLVEVQALATATAFGNPRRTPNGVDFNRLLLITAVLTRRLGLSLAEQDVFVNVVGGLQIEEPAADLAMAIALVSALKDQAVPADWVLLGEIGLSGELRACSQLGARLKEAAKLGFRQAVIPKLLRNTENFPADIKVHQARSVRDAVQLVFFETLK
jgi:DNA repair protein RadA/Sms